ncbi:hypothetical protein BLS_008584 [Venturia inaequalis]|uniref:GH16 domain-containing protein n=1 Tax=Venturia inaequalis TaxID=5025 RepID=A0A8H3Z7N5_VENIN|nr:hypothetical protein BLS_008584 [Venturia inaequalis]KAE9988554.1 hypothetical protein EG328_009687 [Venturia inaequalis]RDI79849.1 hypothetical protein Vi05172_g10105 [Venturia inaequalis]
MSLRPGRTATATSSSPTTLNNPESPDDNTITPVGSNPFSTPHLSGQNSRRGSSNHTLEHKYFHSRRVQKGSIDQPWRDRKDPKEKWVTIVPILGILVGLAISGFLIYDGLKSVVNHVYCPVLEENWSNGINNNIWTKEAELGGFGNGEFEESTVTDENVFVKDGALHIKPTLQDSALLETDGAVLDLTKDGICTSSKWTDCIAVTNSTNGSIINPVKSGRISTKIGAKIKFGRIEVEAKMPSGDWLWPAIWMLPADNVYGMWPRSGEIDIVESRGNNYTYAQGGNNIVSSTLHFGPNSANDGWWTNNVKRKALHTTYASGFHTFGLEWSEKYLFTYIDTRLLQVMYNHFDTPFFTKGRFPLTDSNGTRLDNPWQSGSDATPFDQDFYLILNVAVGGTNGWFKDGASGKPWVDGDPNAKRAFWNARDQWYPTWQKDGEMIVKSVKMWQQKGYNGC